MYGFDDLILSKMFFSTLKSYEYKNILNNNKIKKTIYHCNSDKVIFILPQWMGKTFYFKPLINILNSKHAIVLYDLPYNLLSDNVKLTVHLFNKIADDIISTFNKLQKNGCEQYGIIATSTSTVSAVIACNRDKRCKKLILNLVCNDLAEGIWHSKNPLVMNIKRNLVNKGITLSKLKNNFNVLSYKENSKNLNKKGILIFLSRNDKIIPYNNGIKLLNLLNRDDIEYELVINKLFGHYISGIKNVIFSNKIKNFIDNW